MVNFIMPIKSQSVIPEGLQKLFPQKNSQFFSASSAIADETTTLSNLGDCQKELVSSMKKQIADEGTKSLDSIVSYYSEETFSKATTANQEPVPMVPPAESEFNWPSQNRSQDDFVSEQKAASKTDHSSLLESLTQEPNDTNNSSPIENSTGKSEMAAKSVCKESGSNTQSAPAPENSVNLKVPDSASSESNSKNTFSFMLNFDANASLHIHLATKASPAQDENCNEISQQTTSLSKLGILVEEKTGKELRDLVENPSDFVNNQRSQIVHPNVSKKCSTTVDLAIPFAGNNTRQIVQEDVYMANESKEISRNSPANKVHFRNLNLTAEINASHENIVSKPLISENNSSELLAASESKKKDLDTLTFMDKTSSPTSICDAETSKIHQKVHQGSPNLKMTIPDGTLRALLPDQKHAQTTEIETKTIEEMIETCKKNNVLMHERVHKVDQALAQVRGGLAELKSRPFAKKLKDRKYITSEILSRNHEQQEEIEFMKIHVAYLKFVAASFEYLSKRSSKQLLQIPLRERPVIEPAKLFSVGQNDDGQLGINNSEIHGGIPCTSFFKSVVFRTPVNIIKVACGGMHSLALTSTGKILSWGASEFLGRTTSGSDNCEPRYVEIDDPNVEFMDISCGECFSAAIDSFGKVWTWGSFRNTLGEEFHDVLTQRQHIPKQLFGISVRVVQIACGESHMVVLGEDGRIAGWGFNTHAQLGQPWKPDSRNIAHTQLPFVLPPGGFSARAVFAAGFSTFVAGSLNGSDTLLACGGNLFGELGVGDEKARYWLQEVVELRGKRVVKVAGGLHHTAALDSDGNVWVAGRGDSGQLGLGSSVEHVHTFTKLELNGAQATDLTCSVSGNQTCEDKFNTDSNL
ncbi:hypothetical protein HDU83_001995 [Entophlyctis luteolus]|nr:hypothetical protein HDU83_001995 [Entophlyctis luteolus]